MPRPQQLSGRPLVILSAVLPVLLVSLLAHSSSAGAETCPNDAFRAGPGANLPDCRAYELVTPPFTEAALAPMETSFALRGFAGISADGSHVAVASIGNVGDSQGGARANDYELTRTASGWSETDIDMPVSRFPASDVSVAEEQEALHGERGSLYASEPLQATPDFGKFLYHGPHNALVDWYPGTFWIGEADGALYRIGSGEGEFLGASTDLSHVLFRGGKVSHQSKGEGTLEENSDVAGQEVPAVPVGVGPSGDLCSAEYAAPSQGLSYTPRYGPDGMSANGSVVFFYIPAGGCSSGEPSVSEIFARVEESRTVAISEPSKEDCSACDTSPGVQVPSEIIDGASTDGSKVFFTTTQPLLSSETETSANIYEDELGCGQEQMSACAAAGEQVKVKRVVCVTAGQWRSGGAQVQSVIKVSEDASHVYFLAKGALENAKNSQGKEAVEKESNLYVYDAETGTTAFIAAVSPENPTVTPDGQFLVFESSAKELTGPEDTSTAQQVFEYDAQTGELVRVSIGEDGYNDNGNTDTFNAQIPGQQPNYPVAVSNDGLYVAFESPDGLTPGALNGSLEEVNFELLGAEHVTSYYAENVYEYHDGHVYLVSDGQDTSYSLRREFEGGSAVQVRGMSPSGEDIFFETADRLVPQALDNQKALYDARINGGFPAPVSVLPTCSGDACQGALSPAPTLLFPGSESQSGVAPPQVSPAPVAAAKPKPKAKPKACKKGYVKKKSTCVKRPKAKSKAKKASHNGRAK